MKLSIGKVSEMLGVGVDTIRRWEKEGKIKSERTPGGQRRFDKEDILRFKETRKKIVHEEKVAVIYLSTSNKNGEHTLREYKADLINHCVSKDWEYLLIEDIGYNAGETRKGLIKLIGLIETNRVHTLLLKRKEQLGGYGNEFLNEICKWHQIELIILDSDETTQNPVEAIENFLSSLGDLSAEYFGENSTQHQQIMKLNRSIFNFEEEEQQPQKHT